MDEYTYNLLHATYPERVSRLGKDSSISDCYVTLRHIEQLLHTYKHSYPLRVTTYSEYISVLEQATAQFLSKLEEDLDALSNYR